MPAPSGGDGALPLVSTSHLYLLSSVALKRKENYFLLQFSLLYTFVTLTYEVKRNIVSIF